MLVTLLFVFFQFRFEATNHFSHFFLSHRSAVREISMTRTWIIEQIIAKAEMIEADATNVKIWRRKSKERRRRKSRSCEWEFWLQKWESWWESWLQRDVKDVCHFVWRKDRFLWQSRSRTDRFRRRMLLKTLRTFQTLTNRCLLIGCRHEVRDYSWLVRGEKARLTRWTSVVALRRSKILLMRM